MPQMSEQHWRQLLSRIAQQSCVLLLGPDIPLVVGGVAQPSLVSRLSDMLAAELTNAPDPSLSLAEIAQEVESESDHMNLEMLVEDFHRSHPVADSEIHDDLASIGFPLVVTSSHDGLMEDALRKAGKRPVSEFYDFRGTRQKVEHEATVQEPLVYHIQGSLQRLDSLVITEQDLLEYLVAVASGSPALPDRIRSALQDDRCSFLFIGFGLNRWHLRLLVHLLRGPRPRSMSFAIEAASRLEAASDEQAVLFFRRGFKVETFRVDVPAFARELRVRCDAQRQFVGPIRQVRFHAHKPTVFISYDRRNASKADRVFAALEAEGCLPWLDRHRLEPASDWNAEIEAQLRACDYFLFLNSREANGRHEAFVTREVNMARDRAKSFREGIRFIIPACIDDSPVREELAQYQGLDCAAEGGVEEARQYEQLCVIMQRDLQRRGK